MASQRSILASEEEIRSELANLLRAKAFARAPTLSKMLVYLCEKQLGGEAESIKEYCIAVEALGRTTDFDPEIDSIVRVQASRLRKRLAEHYAAEPSHSVRISLPEGSYIPGFTFREALDLAELPAQPSFAVGEPGTGVKRPATISPPSRTRLLLWIGFGALSLTAILFAILAMPKRQRMSVGDAPKVGLHQTGLQPFALTGPELCILAGGTDPNYVDSSNQFWMPDRYFSGGVVLSRPDRRIRRTLDQSIFRNAREGDFRYDIPLKPGIYELHLYFSELVFGEENMEGTGEGNRRFSVTANGVMLLNEMDIVNDAAGENTADEKVFTDLQPAADGKLHLEFTSLWNRAVLSGIEIEPGLPGKMRPVRILAGSAGAYTNSAGRQWHSDRYFLGGRAIRHSKPVSGTTEQELFRSERFGNFNYAIPVANGTYSVTLFFAETNFGANNFGFARLPNGALQGRLFDVFLNGTTAIKDLDILKESGGAYRAVSKMIHGVRPDAQGKIVLSFVPIRDYPCVHAIEVQPER